ncbi:MAG: PPC domain-containing protein [Chloroflexota bacterium]|nr:PPC domain-containing protein [Chloroflexota bacterium]
MPTPTPTLPPTPTPTPDRPDPLAAEFSIRVGRDTLWRDAFIAFTPNERECIRDTVDPATLESALDERLLAEGDAEEWMVSTFACLAPETASTLLLAMSIGGMEDEGIRVSDDDASCLRSLMAEVDAVAFVAAAVDGGDGANLDDLMTNLMRCVPHAFLPQLLAGMGLDLEALSEDEAQCVQEWIANVDWSALLAAAAVDSDDPAVIQQFVPGLIGCLPQAFLGPFLTEMGVDIEAVTEDERQCVQEWAANTDWVALFAAAASDDAAILGEFLPGLMRCLPHLILPQILAGMGLEMEALSEEEKQCVQAWAADADWSAFLAAGATGDSDAILPLIPGLVACLPDLVTFQDADDDAGRAPAPPPTPASAGADDHADTIAEAERITVGDEVPGTLDYPGDVDVFAFEAAAATIYRIDVTLGTLPYSAAALFDAAGRVLAVNENHGESPASHIYWEAPAAGDYYVEVSASLSRDTGSYRLTIVSEIADDHADTIGEATSITVGDEVLGAVDFPGDADVFAFQAEAGTRYRIDVSLVGLADSVATLYDAAGQVLAENDDYAASSASRIDWTAPAAGDYYVAVTGYSVSTGTYSLSVVPGIADDHADTIGEATSITVGDEVLGVVDSPGDADVFTFEAEAGTLYRIDVSLDSLADSVATLYDAAGQVLAENDDHAASSASRIYWTAPSGGDYYVAVTGYSVSTGTYSLSVVPDVADDYADTIGSATRITVGDVVQGVLDYEDDADIFAFEAAEGTLYRIDVSLDSLADSVVTLYDGANVVLAANDDYEGSLASRIYWTAPAGGDYYVAVTGYGTGAYSLTIVSDIADDHADTIGEAARITVGDVVEGGVNYEDDADVFAFEAEAGAIYEIDVTLVTLADSIVTLYDGAGQVLAANDDHGGSLASRIYWKAPAAGDYYVEVAAVSSHDTGSYRLTIVSGIADDHADTIGEAASITVGGVVLGVVDYPGDADVFAFEASEGTLYRIDVSLVDLTDSVAALYDGAEQLLAANDDHAGSNASRIYWKAPVAGDYYVAVTGYSISTGAYSLTVVPDITDDHADAIGESARITVGDVVQGVMDYEDDADVFAFEAEADTIYQIDVTLGTLTDSVAALYDADARRLTFNDNHAESLASRIFWMAPAAGDYYVEVTAVSSQDSGSYSLTIVAGITDDHANSIERATSIAVGGVVPGGLDYQGDVDLFAFDAEAGRTYLIHVMLETLSDATVVVLNADGTVRGFHIGAGEGPDRALVIVLNQEADRSESNYVEIGNLGNETGSYTVAVEEALTATVVPETGLSVRVEPDAGAEVAYVAPAGSALTLTRVTVVVDGVTWWELADGNWVQGRYLQFG